MKCLPLLAALLMWPTASNAQAPNINVGAMYEYAPSGKSALLKRVRNSGDATAFVRVQISEVRYGTDGQPHELPVDATAISNGATGLIASPSRLIVPAKGQHATRLLFQGDRSAERYYRVRFIPVLPSSEDEFALTAIESEQYRKNLSAGVNVLTGYGVFVVVHPDQPQHDVLTERHADRTVLRNAGNTTAILDNVRQCSGSGRAEQCSPPRKLHLLPGRTGPFVHRHGYVHRFQIVEGDGQRNVQLGP